MANYYTSTSSFIAVPADKLGQVEDIVNTITIELEADPDNAGAGFVAEIQSNGVWIHDDGDDCEPEHMEKLVRAMVEELDLPGIFVCSWAHLCSRPVTDAFGGGAFAVQKGIATVWVDAVGSALEMAEAALEEFKQPTK